MSYDLTLYSPNHEPAQLNEIQVRMQERGWHVVFTAGLNDHTVLPPSGPVHDGMIVFGWKESEPLAPLLTNLVGVGNIKGLWSPDGADLVVATCQMYYTMPYDVAQDYDEEEFEKLVQFDKRYATAMREAESLYVLHAGKSLPSIRFTRAIWQVTASLVGGMIYDGQAGHRQLVTIGQQLEIPNPGNSIIAKLWSRITNR